MSCMALAVKLCSEMCLMLVEADEAGLDMYQFFPGRCELFRGGTLKCMAMDGDSIESGGETYTVTMYAACGSDCYLICEVHDGEGGCGTYSAHIPMHTASAIRRDLSVQAETIMAAVRERPPFYMPACISI